MKWAQWKDWIFITLEVPDLQDHNIDLKETHLWITGKTDTKHYDGEIELFDEVVVSESGWNTKGRYIILSISKKNKEAEEYWPRLTKDKTKNNHIKIDWAKWIDQEDEGKAKKGGMDDDFDPEGMNNFNMGDYGGDNSDDDEEEADGEVNDHPDHGHQHHDGCKHDEEAKADLKDLEGDVDHTN